MANQKDDTSTVSGTATGVAENKNTVGEIKPCTLKLLSPDQWTTAAAKAVEINPSNAPAVHQLRQALPFAIIPPEHLALMTSKYWGIGGVRLTVGFLDNPASDLRAKLLSHMNAWGTFCNVQFVESAVNPQVRISRSTPAPNDGYWSYLGTDILSIPANQPTMNLDGFSMSTPDSEFFRVVRHETGHTLGFPHEHMRSEIVNAIDREKAIAYFMRTQGWSRDMVIAQVLTPIDASALIATAHADPNSIMCYWLPAEIMKNGVAIPGGTDIDSSDGQFAAQVYPKPAVHAWHWADQGTPPGKTINISEGVTTVKDTTGAAQRPYAFVDTTDGHLWVNWWNGSAWNWADQGTPPGKTISGKVGAITVMDTPTSAQRPYAFVLTSDGHLWVNWWNGSAWHWADQGTPPGKTISTAVGAVTMKDTPTSAQRPYVFVQTNDGHLWVNWWNGTAWNWANQGTPPGKTVSAGIGAITMMDTPTSAQRPYAFVKSNDGHLWVNWWNGSAWSWADHGTPPAKTVNSGIGVITVMDTPTSSQRPYAFVQASDGHMWVNWWNGSAWHWADQGTPPGKTISGKVGAVTMMDNPSAAQRPYVFVQTSDGHLWVNWWSGSAWAWADQGTPTGKTVTAGIGVLTMMDTPSSMQRPYAFVKASDGHMWVNWWS